MSAMKNRYEKKCQLPRTKKDLVVLLICLFFLWVFSQRSSIVDTNEVAKKASNSLVCEIGNAPFSHGHIMLEIPTFIEAMKAYHFRMNRHGTVAPHQFALWCIIRHVKPKHIIESGAFNGLGTWLIRQAAPDAQITVISPNITKLYIDKKEDTVYYTGDNFQDFSMLGDSFSSLDKAKTLIFFDDHQSGLVRAKQAFQMGFQHLILDDNYAPGEGDNFSLKQACDESGEVHKLLGGNPVFKSDFGKERRSITMEELRSYAKEMKEMVDVYYEFPPLWDMGLVNRYKMKPDVYRRITKPSILDDSDVYFSKELRTNEGPHYTWVNYVHLKARP